MDTPPQKVLPAEKLFQRECFSFYFFTGFFFFLKKTATTHKRSIEVDDWSFGVEKKKKKTKELMISYVSSFYYQDVDSRALS